MKERYSKIKDREKAYFFGLVEINTKGIGKMIWEMEMGDYFYQMGTFIVDNGKMINIMDMVFIYGLMEINMKDIGWIVKGIYYWLYFKINYKII